MGKLSDIAGSLATQFQIGIGGTGLRRLRFKNGFSGDLEWTPTANRTVTLPDTGGFVQVLSGEVFEQSSKPTTRRDGSSLVTGDRWLDTTDRLWWYWNGTYWLSEQIFSFDAAFPTTISASTFPGGFRVNTSYNLFLLELSFTGTFVAGTYDSTNYWTARLLRDAEASTSSTTDTTLTTLQSTIASNEARTYSTTLNVHRNVSSLSIARLRIDAIKNSAAPNINLASGRILYRLAKP